MEQARLDCARGDFESAAKHMRLAAGAAPDHAKSRLEELVKRLEAKEDINK